MKFLVAAIVMTLALFAGDKADAAPKDSHLKHLFERLEHAPDYERPEIRKQIRKYLRYQKREQRRENLSKLREKREMRHREERDYHRDNDFRGPRGHR